MKTKKINEFFYKITCTVFTKRYVWELLYADDLVIIARSMKELEDSYCA